MKKKIAILTSGGDSPGMNAAIRSAARLAIQREWKVYGVFRGYSGLINGQIEELGLRSVSNIIQRGGTILRTSRCKEFETKKGMQKAAGVLDSLHIDSLILIGGNGTFRGGEEFGQIWKGQLIGIPGTIDNDIFGSDNTIGFHTAVTTAVEALDKIRDTAEAHERMFLVEVMGRQAGYIALATVIAGGAEEFFIPEIHQDLADVAERLSKNKKRGKTSSIIVVAEGNEHGSALEIAERLKKMTGNEYRVTVLGYVQRGGAPVPEDRILATKLGAYAIDMLADGVTGVMVGEVKGALTITAFRDTWEKKKELDQFLLKIAPIIAL